MRDVTLCFLVDDARICLALKKRGFGVGKWNGVGGKVDQGESIEEAALRELEEEIDVRAQKDALEKQATIEFTFQDTPNWNQRMHVFFIRTWNGEPQDSEEMAPAWYSHHQIPYDQMWKDDSYWLPRLISGEKLEGTFHLSSDGSEIQHWSLSSLPKEG